jgi:hypothetical protein
MRASLSPPSGEPIAARPSVWGRVVGSALVLAALAALFVAVAPLRRQVADYHKRFRELAKADAPLYDRRSGAGRGFETLPALVQAMAVELDREKLASYWVSPDLTASGQLWQRIVEGNWPRVPRSSARAVFRPQGRHPDPGCRIAPMTAGYELMVCP